MNTLLLMRHAKSSWDDPALADHDRPLNKRGKQDAPRMGRWLRDADLVPDLIVTSSAKRARKTARLVAEACGYDGELLIRPELYHAPPDVWAAVVRALPDTASRVLCVGHNPGLEATLAAWTGQAVAMPTATIAHLRMDAPSWSDFGDNTTVTLEGVQQPS